jgi:hypothetical protein
VERKRLAIDLEEGIHAMLMSQARQRNLTLSNFVRHSLHLPLERQGVRLDSTQIVLPMIEDVAEFYLLRGHASFCVLIPGPGGLPYQVTPPPRLSKATYMSREAAVHSGQMQLARNDLRGDPSLLLLDVAQFNSDVRAVRVFVRGTANYQAPPNAVTYLAATSRAAYSWISDLDQGKRGYFLTGLPNASDLWEIISCEPDPADRLVFNLSRVGLPNGLPSPDFSKIGDAVLRGEAQQHWANLARAVIDHNPYALVNSAASLSEALLRAFLKVPGPPNASLSDMLERLRSELDSGNSAFSVLSYHVMQSIRVMHQSTQHPGRVVTNGRPVRPRVALGIAESMVEVLSALSLVEAS